jgi:hypothetical protein
MEVMIAVWGVCVFFGMDFGSVKMFASDKRLKERGKEREESTRSGSIAYLL